MLVLHGNAAGESSCQQHRYGRRGRFYREVQRRIEISVAADATNFVAGIDQEFLFKFRVRIGFLDKLNSCSSSFRTRIKSEGGGEENMLFLGRAWRGWCMRQRN